MSNKKLETGKNWCEFSGTVAKITSKYLDDGKAFSNIQLKIPNKKDSKYSLNVFLVAFGDVAEKVMENVVENKEYQFGCNYSSSKNKNTGQYYNNFIVQVIDPISSLNSAGELTEDVPF